MGLLRIAKQSRLAKLIVNLLGDQWVWTLGAITEKAAMKTAIGALSAELFDKQGIQLADELKARMPPNSIVLDFGCGIGRPEKFLSPYCKEIYGADISRGMLRLARTRHKDIPNVHFVKSGKTALSVFRDSTFDFVFSEAVFQHMDKEHVILMLTEIYRVCRQGGRACLQFCNLLCPYNLDNFIAYARESRILTTARSRYWLPQEARLVMEKIGFEILNLEVKSDCRDTNRDFLVDDYHRDYSIWVFALKK